MVSEGLISIWGEVAVHVDAQKENAMMVRVAEHVLRFQDQTRRDLYLQEIKDETGKYVPGPSIRVESPCAMHMVIQTEKVQIPSSDANMKVFLVAVIFGSDDVNAYIVLHQSEKRIVYYVIMNSPDAHSLFGGATGFQARMRAVEELLKSQCRNYPKLALCDGPHPHDSLR